MYIFSLLYREASSSYYRSLRLRKMTSKGIIILWCAKIHQFKSVAGKEFFFFGKYSTWAINRIKIGVYVFVVNCYQEKDLIINNIRDYDGGSDLFPLEIIPRYHMVM